MKSTLRVNGKTREIDAPRRTTLLSALREMQFIAGLLESSKLLCMGRRW